MKYKEISLVYQYQQTTAAAFTPIQCLDWRRETSKKEREKDGVHTCEYFVCILKCTAPEMEPNQEMTPVFKGTIL